MVNAWHANFGLSEGEGGRRWEWDTYRGGEGRRKIGRKEESRGDRERKNEEEEEEEKMTKKWRFKRRGDYFQIISSSTNCYQDLSR